MINFILKLFMYKKTNVHPLWNQSFGVNSIKINDIFNGFACNTYFTNQVCKGFTKEDLIIGETTLVVFKKENIKLINK